jgi:hypothetical protein
MRPAHVGKGQGEKRGCRGRVQSDGAGRSCAGAGVEREREWLHTLDVARGFEVWYAMSGLI